MNEPPRHSCIVLFYKYFCPSEYPLIHEHQHFYEEKLLEFQREQCRRLGFKGRVLLAPEGINGTLSASRLDDLNDYIDSMELFELVRDCGVPNHEDTATMEHNLFRGIDWKTSTVDKGILEPFPDLKISAVKEIINSGGVVSVDDLRDGGKHLSPADFHQAISDDPNAVLIDVRNTFEYDIGHFINPNTQEDAINPETVTFSSFDATFCARKADELKGKKCYMYCTGGVRCEKASVMLKKRGVKDVYQLKGGIHRYLEQFGDNGFFRGLNFVFDQRVAMKPSESGSINSDLNASSIHCEGGIVGKCIECNSPFDEICGSRICTVCRDLVLVCPTCQKALREYHCRRHSSWKLCYFTFLEVFDRESLEDQRSELLQLRTRYAQRRNIRKTVSRQIGKVSKRLSDLESGHEVANPKAPRRCRSCMAPISICDGRCWGFWRTQG